MWRECTWHLPVVTDSSFPSHSQDEHVLSPCYCIKQRQKIPVAKNGLKLLENLLRKSMLPRTRSIVLLSRTGNLLLGTPLSQLMSTKRCKVAGKRTMIIQFGMALMPDWKGFRAFLVTWESTSSTKQRQLLLSRSE